MNLTSYRRRITVTVVAGTVVALTGACSSGSSSSSTPPGGGGVKAAAVEAVGIDSSAIDALISAEQPATELPAGLAQKIKDRGQLLVGGTQTAALFSLLDPTTGKVQGFDAGLSQLLAKYIIGKPDTKLVNVTSATREALLQNGSVDSVFATYTITPERAEKVNFAGPYYQDGLGIQVRKGTTGINSFADLNGKTVITESGSTVPDAVKKAAPDAKIQLFDTNVEAVQALSQKRGDAYVLDQSILAGNSVTNPAVQTLPQTFSKELYGIGLPKNDPQFTAFVNTWLKQIEADGTWAKLWKATVGTQVPGDAPQPPTIG